MLVRRFPMVFVSAVLMLTAGCGAALDPVPVPSPTTSTSPLQAIVAPSICTELQTAPAGSTVKIPSGAWIIGDCVVDGEDRPGIRVVAVNPATTAGGSAASGAVSKLIGSLRCRDCDRWLFDGLAVEGDGSGSADPVFVVSMSGGRGWRWTRCDISNGVAADGTRHGVRGVFNTFGSVQDWQLDACRVHDNGNTRPDVLGNNFDHLVYINGADIDSNGRIGPNNQFFGNESGAPVKIGYGLDGGVPVGIRGVRFEDNVISGTTSPDGICGVLVAGASANTVVARNRIDCTGGTDENASTAIALRSWPGGTRVTIADNRVSGTRNAGVETKCGAPVAGPYDRTISVRVFGYEAWAQVAPAACSWWGISATGNTAVAG